MKSKTSFFNCTLFGKNLKRCWPLWGLPSIAAIIGAVLVYIAGMVENSRGDGLHINVQDAINSYYEVLVYFVPIWSMIFALACAMAVWNFMYSPKSVGMMHSLPIKRSGIFFTNFLSGMTMMAIPYVVAAVLIVPYISMHGGRCPGAVTITILGVIAESFFFFSLATVTGQLVGTTAMLPLLYTLINFLQIIIVFLVKVLIAVFVYGYTLSVNVTNMIFVPVVFLYNNVKLNVEYEEHFDDGYYSTVVNSTIENGEIIVYYALAGVALAALAFFLYAKRKSETAQDTISFVPVKKFLLYLLSGLAGFGAGYVLYLLYCEIVYVDYKVVKAFPMIVCCLIMGAIAYYLASMALNKTLKVFNRKNLAGFLGLSATYIVLILVFAFDIFGISKRIPDISDIKSATMFATYAGVDIDETTDADTIRRIYDYNKKIMENSSEYRNEGIDADWVTRGYISIKYELKNGLTFEREYEVYVTEENLYREGTLANLLYEIDTDPVLFEASHRLKDAIPFYVYFYSYLDSANSYITTDSADSMFALRDAVVEDLYQSPRADVLRYVASEYGEYGEYGGEIIGNIEFEFRVSDGYTKFESYEVTSTMLNTINALVEAECLDSKILNEFINK